MTDHAKTIRDALMWAQAYAPDRLAHRLIDAEESLRELLAGHAAEVAEVTLGAERQAKRAAIAEAEATRLRAELEQLRQENAVFEESADFWEQQTSDSNAKWTQAERENERLTKAFEQACTNLAVHHGTREIGRSIGDDAELWKACLLAGWGGWQGYREEFGDVRLPPDPEDAALAVAQEPPHCTCQSSWPSDLRCPACEAAAQEPPAECPDCGLDLEPGEKHGQVEGIGCVAQEPPAKGDDR